MTRINVDPFFQGPYPVEVVFDSDGYLIDIHGNVVGTWEERSDFHQ